MTRDDIDKPRHQPSEPSKEKRNRSSEGTVISSTSKMDPLATDTYQFYLDPSFADTDFANFPDFTQVLSDPSHMGTVEPPAKKRTRLRAAKACLACRSRHMKCDSVEPKCMRCQLDEKECVYTKSRRGGSHKVSPPEDSPQRPPFGETSTSSDGRTPGLEADLDLGSLASAPTMDSLMDGTISSERQDHDLIGLFYEYLHEAHPIVLPKAYFLARRKSDPDSLDYLIPVLEWIGSMYNTNIDSDRYQQIADQALNSTNVPCNGFTVQALVLYALAKNFCDEYDDADIYCEKAIDIALSIGMDRKDFAERNGEGVAVLEESWRRTWWMLYMIDVVFAAVNFRRTHRLPDIGFEVDLPCEDWDYESNKIPRPRTFEEYDNREFLHEEVVFSSMAYLIDSVRIGSSITSAKIMPFSPGNLTITAADTKIVNWFLYLPKCKQEVVKEDGKVDETMFLALVTINIDKMQLHRPHSALAFSAIETRSRCTPPAPQQQVRDMQRSVLLHTAKALEATSAAIMLFASPSPIIKHSPIVTCALALATMKKAQVSACNHVLKLSDKVRTEEERKGRAEAYEMGRDRVRLGLGALRSSMHVWPLPRRSVKEVVAVSRELLTRDARECPLGSEDSRDSISEALS